MIRLFGGRLKVNLLMIPAFGLMCFFYGSRTLLGFFAALVIHECAHAAAASAIGIRVNRLEVQPYGCAAVIEGLGDIRPSAELLIAAAGPAANIVCMCIADSMPSGELCESFSGACLGLFCVNMLPCPKTDGGRILSAMMSRRYRSGTVSCVLFICSLISGIAMASAFVYLLINGELNITLAIFALFIIISSADARKRSAILKGNKLAIRRRIMSSGYAEVCHHVLREHATAGEAISIMEAGKYNIFYLVDDAMRIKAKLDEGEVIRRALKEGTSVRMLKR